MEYDHGITILVLLCGLFLIFLFEVNELMYPFVMNSPHNKYCGIIQYKQIYCLFCNDPVTNRCKRTILGISLWNGGISCNMCTKSH